MVEINKIIVIIPVFLITKQLFDNELGIPVLRTVFAFIQLTCLAVVFYTYFVCIQLKHMNTIVYIPTKTTTRTNNKDTTTTRSTSTTKYIKTTYSKHIQSVARKLVGSCILPLLITLLLHIKLKLNVGLGIQCFMSPMSLVENTLIMAILNNTDIRPESKLFDEKTSIEMKTIKRNHSNHNNNNDNDDSIIIIVDEHGQPQQQQDSVQQQTAVVINNNNNDYNDHIPIMTNGTNIINGAANKKTN